MRETIYQYAMSIATVVASRSEDPVRKVGAVALSHDNRIIATAYNGLMPRHNMPPLLWNDEQHRLSVVIHAEMNLCSLFKRSEAKFVAVTTMPCQSCLKVLLAHDVRHIIYSDIYERDKTAIEIAKFYDINLEQIKS